MERIHVYVYVTTTLDHPTLLLAGRQRNGVATNGARERGSTFWTAGRRRSVVGGRPRCSYVARRAARRDPG